MKNREFVFTFTTDTEDPDEAFAIETEVWEVVKRLKIKDRITSINVDRRVFGDDERAMEAQYFLGRYDALREVGAPPEVINEARVAAKQAEVRS